MKTNKNVSKTTLNKATIKNLYLTRGGEDKTHNSSTDACAKVKLYGLGLGSYTTDFLSMIPQYCK